MKYFIRLFVASLFIASCFAPPVQTDISSQIPTVVAPTPNYTSNNQSSYNNSNNNNNNNNDNNSDTCEDDNDCEDMCDEIFDEASSGDRRDCKEDLSVSAVEDMQDAYDIIKEADEDDLDDLNISDLEEIMDISIEPIVDLLDGYRSSEAKEFLVWLFDEDNEEALKLFKNEDEDYEMLEAALQNLDSDVIEALGIKIDGGDDIFQYLIGQDQDEALEWIHDFFVDGTGKNKNGVCKDDKCTFDKYCRVLNKGFKSPRDRKKIFDYGYFKEFMEDLLSEADFEKLKKGEDYEDFCNTRLNYRLDSTKSDSNTSNTSVSSCGDTATEAGEEFAAKAFFFKIVAADKNKTIEFKDATKKGQITAASATLASASGYCPRTGNDCVLTATRIGTPAVPASGSVVAVKATRYIKKLNSYRRKNNEEHELKFRKAKEINRALIQIDGGYWKDVVINPINNKKTFTFDGSNIRNDAFKLILLNNKCQPFTKDITS